MHVGLVLRGLLYALAAASFFALTVEANELDFGFPGEATLEANTKIITGELIVKVPLHWYNIAYFAVSVRNALASVAVVSTPVVLQTFQFMRNFGINPAELHMTYYVLPHGASAVTVKDRIASAAASGTFRQLLAWQTSQDKHTAHIDVDTWEVELGEPETKSAVVMRPIRIPPPPPSQTEALAEALVNSGSAVRCPSAETGCLCAAMKGCAWLPRDTGDAFHCVDAEDASAPTDVPCIHCAVQSKCPKDPVRMCEAQLSPCSCAMSIGDCFWDNATLTCTQRHVEYTTCRDCSRQDHCGAPSVVSISPAAGSLLGEPPSRELEVTFDRMVQYTGMDGDLLFQCWSDDQMIIQHRPVPESSLEIQGHVLRIDAAGVQNTKPLVCNLLINEGAVRDADGLWYEGMMSGEQYQFTLGDTIAPSLSTSVPKHGEDLTSFPLTLQLNFSEHVRLSSSFFAELVVQEGGASRVLATFEGPNAEGVEVTDSLLAFDLLSVKDRGVAGSGYSLVIPSGALTDTVGNPFAGFELGAFSFRESVLVGDFLVQFSTTMESVDYEMLIEDAALVTEVKVAVRQVIAAETGGKIGADNIEVELAAGSVVLHCTIAVQDESVAAKVQLALETSTTLAEALSARLAGNPKLAAISTGVVTVNAIAAPVVRDNRVRVGAASASHPRFEAPFSAAALAVVTAALPMRRG